MKASEDFKLEQLFRSAPMIIVRNVLFLLFQLIFARMYRAIAETAITNCSYYYYGMKISQEKHRSHINSHFFFLITVGNSYQSNTQR